MMSRLVFSKILDDMPKLKVIVHHFGSIVPTLEGRVGPGWDQLGARTSDEDYGALLKSLKKRPLDYFKHDFYPDTATFTSEGAMKLGFGFFDFDKVIFASDCPFDPEKGTMYIRETLRILDELRNAEGRSRQGLLQEPGSGSPARSSSDSSRHSGRPNGRTQIRHARTRWIPAAFALWHERWPAHGTPDGMPIGHALLASPHGCRPHPSPIRRRRRPTTGRVTPMMEQYIEIKAANPDCLLFYRMGDFYEMFFDDAEIASRALGIVLTKRGKHLGHDIPMCGVPVERSDEYLHRLIALGHRVAVCEQLEDPAEAQEARRQERGAARRGAPGHARHAHRRHAARRQAQQLPAGDRARAHLLGRRRQAASRSPGSTSRPANSASPNASAARSPPRSRGIEPGEIIVSDALYADAELAPLLRALPAVTPLTRDVFDGATAERRLSSILSRSRPPRAFGTLSRLELTAAAACVTYVERTQLGKRPPLSPPLRESAGATLAIDQATRANLELMRTLSGERRGSLLAAIDRTVTAAGSRLLAQRLAAPLTDPDAIARRLDAVALFVADAGARAPISARGLKAAPDLARALSRLAVGRGGPRDLAAIRDGVLGRRRSRARARGARRTRPPRSPKPLQSLPPPATACCPPNCRRRSPTSCRPSSATAASCAKATTPRSTRRARCATNRAA